MGNFFVRRPIVAMVIAIVLVIVGVVFLMGLPVEQLQLFNKLKTNASKDCKD